MNSLRQKAGELFRQLINEPALERSGQGLLVMRTFPLKGPGRNQFLLSDWQSQKHS